MNSSRIFFVCIIEEFPRLEESKVDKNGENTKVRIE